MAKCNKQSYLINPIETLKWSSHKSYLKDLAAAGLPVVPTVWIKPGEESKVRLATGFGRRQAFMKPSVGSTSSGTLLFDVGGDNEKAIAHAAEQLSSQDEILMQPFCPSIMEKEKGEFSVLLWDGAFSHGVRKVPVPGDYRA